MWLSDLLQDSVPLLSYAVAIRQPVLLIGFIEASVLRRLATLPPHRNLIEITSDWFDVKEDKLAQLPLLFQSETVNLTAPRLTLVAPNLPTRFLPALFNLPRAWVASTLNQPSSLPDNVITFNLRTKNLLNAEEGQLASHYLLSLLAGVESHDIELMLQAGLRLVAAKAQSLLHLTRDKVKAEQILRLLNIQTHSELDLCIAIAKADYSLDLDTFQEEAYKPLSQKHQVGSGDSRLLLEKYEKLRCSMIHVDDVRTMLAGITDNLAARGIPPNLLTRIFSTALNEWIPEPRS